MIRLAIRTFTDRWQLFVGTVLAITAGVAIVHAGMTIILGIENATAPEGLGPADADAFNQSASGASTLTGMTVMLGAFLTIFVVGSTFSFAVDQRRGDLAVLRLGGVTSGQIRRLLLGEALLAGLIGTITGAVLGIGLTVVQRSLLSWLGTLPADLDTPLRPAVLILDLAIALGVSLAGSWGAARRATKVSPLDALRRSAIEQKVMTVSRWIVAVIAIALTAVQAYFSATTGGMLIPLLLGLGIVITASIAMSRLSPLLVPAVSGLLAPWSRRSPVASLAVANLRDAVRRTASCAAPMIVLVSLVMGLQGILDTQTKAAASETTQLLKSDLVASGDDIDLAALEDLDGIALAAPETTVPLSVQLIRGGMPTSGPGTVVAVDPDAFRATHLQTPNSGDLADFGGKTIVFGPGLDNTMIADRYDEVTVSIDGEPVAVDEAARMSETLAGTDGFYIDRAILPPEVLDRPTKVLIQLEPGANARIVAQTLTEVGATSVQTPEELSVEQDSVSANENRAVMAAIVGLGSLYALISVLSTLAISIGQRRSELATLRLTGLTRAEIRRTTVLEAVAATVIGLVLGALAAVLSLVGLWAATARVYGFPVIAIPWELLAVMTVLTAGLTIATATIATRSALKPPAIQALGDQQ
ncbi:FtsX-like permease family protein [Brevibacterium luteolum]|uniref:FtsX-like permease family protein n=1 Tax=Brevibacterium luteolum TaxID=199591 RepID=UPI001C22790C|nr:FtsX-like permease family protein [Brevibacterium luteolum]MBU8578688.1 FtsX-like permease family protein [Brevibacterium luteolum]